MPIAMAREEWERIRGWAAGEGRRAPEAARRREYLEYLDNASYQMTKDWPNSLENVNKRNEESRLARIQKAEQANEIFYKEYVSRQQAEQQRLMEQARDAVFKDKDAPKTLLSAVIACAIQKEQMLQKEFQANEKRYLEERNAKDANDQIEQAHRWLDERNQRTHARFLTNKKHQEDIAQQAKEIAERNRREREEEIRLEQEDNMKAMEQMAGIKEFEKNFKLSEKARIKADMELATREVARRVREGEQREELDEQLRQVYLQYKHRVDCRRTRTEKELQAEKLRILEKISQKLQTGSEAQDRREQEILDKARREKIAVEDARIEKDRLKVERQIQDKKDQRQKYLRDEEQRLHKEDTMNTWAMLNRCKNMELTRAFDQRQRDENWKRILNHREDLLTLWKERADREARELAERRFFYGELAERKLRDADDKLLRHGERLKREAAELGRPTYALERALDAYRGSNRLRPMPELPASQQEHYPAYAPADRTRPYAAAPLPLAFDPGARHDASQWRPRRRADGLPRQLDKQRSAGPLTPPAPLCAPAALHGERCGCD